MASILLVWPLRELLVYSALLHRGGSEANPKAARAPKVGGRPVTHHEETSCEVFVAEKPRIWS